MEYLLLSVVIWLGVYFYLGWVLAKGNSQRWFWTIFWGFSPLLLRFSGYIKNFNAPNVVKLGE